MTKRASHCAQLLERLKVYCHGAEFDEDFVSPVRCQQNLRGTRLD